MRVGCVVLTTGERPELLAAAIASVAGQREVTTEIAVVVNADVPVSTIDAIENLDEAVVVVAPGRNLGIPEGRNVGAERVRGCDIVLFLDDDATLVDRDTLKRAARMFEADATLGVVTMRIVDPDTGESQRRHVPRLVVGDPTRSSWVTTFLGGACIVRADAFATAGGLPGEFFYAHEETSLAWRLLDRGYRIRYTAELVVHHPGLPPARHAAYHRLTARNRVLLARKHLPMPVAVVYVGVWVALGLARARGGARNLLVGFVEGLRVSGVDRRPISWRTIARMARYGRPPLV